MSLPTSTETSTPTTQNQHVQDQYIALFLQQNKRAQISIMISMVMVFLLLRLRIQPDWAWAWLALITVVSAIRLGFTRRMVMGASKPIGMITFLLLLNGMCIVLPVLAFSKFTDIERTFVTIVLTALATGAAVSTSGYKGMFLWFAATLLLPLSAAWALTASTDGSPWPGRGLGTLIVIYLIFLAGLGKDAYRVFNESCRIRFAEQDLNRRLGEALDGAQLANVAKTRFLAAASHDLRQPLHTIGMLVAALGLRKPEGRNKEIIDMLGTVSQSLSGQLDGLLDVSKLDAGIVQPALQVVSLTQLVQSHVASVTLLASEKQLYVTVHCPEPVFALTDASLFQRVLSNLTSNAMKFTASGGVELSVRKQGQHALIEVIDTGLGIDTAQQQLVFQEFYQVGNDERDRSKGLGLGLAIVQRLCALLNIELTLSSKLGEGSRFTLHMTLSDNLPAGLPSVSNESVPGLASLRVLVIDDEADVRAGMQLLLEELGCNVALADDAEQARKEAEAGKVDMVISDFRLKDGASGIEAIRQIQHFYPKAYALLITGDTAPDRLQQAHAANLALLHKPVVLNQLVTHLNAAKASHDI